MQGLSDNHVKTDEYKLLAVLPMVDPDPRRGLKWIPIRPNAVDPDPDPKR